MECTNEQRKLELAEIGSTGFYAYYKNHRLYKHYNYKIKSAIKSTLREKMVEYVSKNVRGKAKYVVEVLLMKFFNVKFKSSSFGLCCPSIDTIQKELVKLGHSIHSVSISRILSRLSKLGIMSSLHMFCGATYRFFNFEILEDAQTMLKVSKKQKQRKEKSESVSNDSTPKKTQKQIVEEIKARTEQKNKERAESYKRINKFKKTYKHTVQSDDGVGGIVTTKTIENAFKEALNSHYEGISHINLNVAERGKMKNTIMRVDDPVKLIKFTVANWKEIYKRRFAGWEEVDAPKHPDLRFIMRMYKIVVTEMNDEYYKTKQVNQNQKMTSQDKPRNVMKDIQQAVMSPAKRREFEERYNMPFTKMMDNLGVYFDSKKDTKDKDSTGVSGLQYRNSSNSMDDF